MCNTCNRVLFDEAAEAVIKADDNIKSMADKVLKTAEAVYEKTLLQSIRSVFISDKDGRFQKRECSIEPISITFDKENMTANIHAYVSESWNLYQKDRRSSHDSIDLTVDDSGKITAVRTVAVVYDSDDFGKVSEESVCYGKETLSNEIYNQCIQILIDSNMLKVC